MCGIAGILNLEGRFPPGVLGAVARHMADCMVHRGPDDSGVWVDPTGYCALSQRRLSIIDLSPSGHQPMVAGDGQACITFNGEIYNFQELRQALESRGSTFNTKSDTEVLIEAMRVYGKDAFPKIDGMYAFALFDQRSGDIILARDPFGEKPLYYTEQRGYFAFASELSALTVAPDFDATIDEDALAQYFFLQYVQSPRTIYRSVKKLPPGHFLTITREGKIRIESHFQFRPYADNFRKEPIGQLADELEEILIRSVKRRLISDVPLGAFLSGGVDSSLVVAMMSKVCGADVKTFSIGFEGAEDSEHLYARMTANHLGTSHHEKILSPNVIDLTKLIGRVLDEPNADSSCLPTYLLSQFARESVTVALSGDGGDELFGGYGRYFATLEECDRKLAGDPNMGWWSPSAAYLGPRIAVFPETDLKALLGEIPLSTERLIAEWRDRLDGTSHPLLHRMRQFDVDTYMPGAVLAKVDRMAMQHSLEVRCPFLSREVAEFAASLSPDHCYNNGEGKRILKEILCRYLPREWVHRKKQGFGLPTGLWGRDELLNTARDICVGPNAQIQNWIPRANILKFIEKQEALGSFSTYQVWSLLILETWLKNHVADLGQGDGRESVGSRFWQRELELYTTGAPVLLYLAEQKNPDAVIIGGERSPDFFDQFLNIRAIIPAAEAGSADKARLPMDWRKEPFWNDGDLLRSIPATTGGLIVLLGRHDELPIDSLHILAAKGYKEILCKDDTGWYSVGIATHSIQLRKMLAMLRRRFELFFDKIRRGIGRRIIRKFSKDLQSFTPQGFVPEEGHCYRVHMPQYAPWANGTGTHPSEFLLFENETLLRREDNHFEIRAYGLGRFSHWANDVFFSTTDNSDPRTNGREYRFIHNPRKTAFVRKLGFNFEKCFVRLEDTTSESLKRFLSGIKKSVFETPGIPNPKSYARLIRSSMVGDRKHGLQILGKETGGICLYIGHLGPGGAERQLCYLARGLKQRGHSVRILCSSNVGYGDSHYLPLLEKADIPVTLVNRAHKQFRFENLVTAEGIYDLWLLRRLPQEFAQTVGSLYTHLMMWRPSVLHCFLDQPNIQGGIAGWLAGIPRIVLSTRNVNPTNFPYLHQEWLKSCYQALALSDSMVLSGNSFAGARSYADWLGLSQNRFSVVHNALDMELFNAPARSDVEALRKELRIEKGTPVIAGVFRLSEEKRPLLFIEIVKSIKKEIPNLVAVVAGIGVMMDQFKEAIQKGGLSDCVRILGRRDDVATVVSVADIMLLVSEHEGTPNVLMEAQWLERPVVATNVGDVSEIVMDGVSGYVLEKDDIAGIKQRCLELLKDEVLRAKFGRAGKEKISRDFTIDRMVEKSMELYGEYLKDPSLDINVKAAG